MILLQDKDEIKVEARFTEIETRLILVVTFLPSLLSKVIYTFKNSNTNCGLLTDWLLFRLYFPLFQFLCLGLCAP